MKKILLPALALVIFGFNTASDKPATDMAGVYKMLSQSVNNGTKDSLVDGLSQLKIYTKDYFMYANVHTADSIASFGIGKYTMQSDGKLTEHSMFRASDTSFSADPDDYTLDIKKTAKGYIQVIKDIGETQGQKFSLTEEYEAVNKTTTSPLDGAWKQTKGYYVSGNDTTSSTATQFKTFYHGYFIWGHTYKDSTQKQITNIGFGSFEMAGNNKSKETITNSNYSGIVGRTFNIDIKFTGTDEFMQTITDTNGEKNVEIYQRLK